MQSNNLKSENLKVISLKILIKHIHRDGTKRGNRSESGRLSLIHPHWHAYPCGVGIILGDVSDTTSLSSTSISNVNLLKGSYVADCVFFIHIGLHILVIILGDFNM